MIDQVVFLPLPRLSFLLHGAQCFHGGSVGKLEHRKLCLVGAVCFCFFLILSSYYHRETPRFPCVLRHYWTPSVDVGSMRMGTLILLEQGFVFFLGGPEEGGQLDVILHVAYVEISEYCIGFESLQLRFEMSKSAELVPSSEALHALLVCLDGAILRWLKCKNFFNVGNTRARVRVARARSVSQSANTFQGGRKQRVQRSRSISTNQLFTTKHETNPPLRRGSFGSLDPSVSDVDLSKTAATDATDFSSALLCDTNIAKQYPNFVLASQTMLVGSRFPGHWVIHLRGFGKASTLVPAIFIPAPCGIVALFPLHGILYPFFYRDLQSFGVKGERFSFRYDVPVLDGKKCSTTYVFQMHLVVSFQLEFERRLKESGGRMSPCPAMYPPKLSTGSLPTGEDLSEELLQHKLSLTLRLRRKMLKEARSRHADDDSMLTLFNDRFEQDALEERDTEKDTYRNLLQDE